MSQYFRSRLPLFYVFLSGIGFSVQTLIIKVLAEEGFHATFQCVFTRGVLQCLLASVFLYCDKDRALGAGSNLFGDTNWIRFMLFVRSLAGFTSISLSFLAVELISIGDATVLTKLSPVIAAMFGCIVLGEPWHRPELCASAVSLLGAALVAKPPFLFGKTAINITGVAYALVSSIAAAVAFVSVRILGTSAKISWANVCFAQALGQMVLSIPTAYIFDQTFQFDISLFQCILLIAGGSIGAVSQVLMTIGMQREKSAAASAMRISDVAFGYLWQALFTPDKVNPLSFAGAVLVASSTIIIVTFKEAELEGETGADTEAGSAVATSSTPLLLLSGKEVAALASQQEHKLADSDIEMYPYGRLNSAVYGDNISGTEYGGINSTGYGGVDDSESVAQYGEPNSLLSRRLYLAPAVTEECKRDSDVLSTEVYNPLWQGISEEVLHNSVKSILE